MQFNMYHHYTVDEHLLYAVGNLAEIERGTGREDYPLVREVMSAVTQRVALYVAVFLHDIAKGREEDHTLAGMNVARRLCPRLGLSPEETDTVVALIRLHLVMSDTAQRRDLGDRRTIETFAAQVQTVERLKMLFVLTVCDIRAVGPGVWNAWKGELLRTLYWETHLVLTGGQSAADRDRRADIAREELRKALPSWTARDFEAYAGRHQQPYWLKVDLATKLRHARLLNMSEVEMPGPVTDVAVDSGRGVTVLTVMAPDHPRVLSIIAGACAAAAANIVDAQVFTTVDGVAMDTICISRAFDFDEDELRRGARIALAVERALQGQIRIQDFVAGRAAAMQESKPFDVTPEVSINNLLSNRFSVLEFSGLDRPGLLFDLTRVISMLELNIHSAHIATFGEKAVDAFYVTDFNGEKIVSERRQETIRRRMYELFGGAKAAAARNRVLNA
jgi:[protein-PII] uridylyltransferase